MKARILNKRQGIKYFEIDNRLYKVVKGECHVVNTNKNSGYAYTQWRTASCPLEEIIQYQRISFERAKFLKPKMV